MKNDLRSDRVVTVKLQMDEKFIFELRKTSKRSKFILNCISRQNCSRTPLDTKLQNDLNSFFELFRTLILWRKEDATRRETSKRSKFIFELFRGETT